MEKIHDAETSAKTERATQVRALLGFVLQISWVPVPLYLSTVEWSGLPALNLAPVALFFAGAAVSAYCAQHFFAQTLKDDDSATFGALPAILYIAACAAFFAALFLNNPFSCFCISLAITGCSAGLAAPQWERCLLCLSRKQCTIAVLCYVACTCLFAFVMPLVHTYIALGISALCCMASAGLRPRHPYPQPAPAAYDSKLLRLRMASFDNRTALSMLILGCASTIPIVLFASSDVSFIGNSATVSREIASWTPLAFLLFAALAAAAWLPKREPDSFIMFRAVFVVALLSFFPVSPGTEFNMWLVLVFSTVWVICIAGSIALVSYEINQRYAQLGALSIGRNVVFLCLGVLLGIAILVAIRYGIPQFYGIASRTVEGTMLVCSASMACVMLIFLATNVLITHDMLHEIALFGQGKLAFHIPTEIKPSSQASQPACADAKKESVVRECEKQPIVETKLDFVSRCKNIALKYGLTPRELEVFIILSQGNTLARVQEELVISEGTAITHRRNIYRKLDVHSKQELIDFVHRSNEVGEK